MDFVGIKISDADSAKLSRCEGFCLHRFGVVRVVTYFLNPNKLPRPVAARVIELILIAPTLPASAVIINRKTFSLGFNAVKRIAERAAARTAVNDFSIAGGELICLSGRESK